MDSLTTSLMGNYNVITDLLKVLVDGEEGKRLLDIAINQCSPPLLPPPPSGFLGAILLTIQYQFEKKKMDVVGDTMINLRESILIHRVAGQAENKRASLSKGVDYLDRYFCLVVFSNYCHTVLEGSSSSAIPVTFSQWKMARHEIVSMHERLRRRGVSVISFRPLEDLAVLRTAKNLMRTDLDLLVKKRKGRVLGSANILKIDYWASSTDEPSKAESSICPGAPNFRQVGQSPIFGVAQPTVEGISHLLAMVNDEGVENGAKGTPPPKRVRLEDRKVVWINLREEPLVYINGKPFVLRDEHATTRNLTTFAGIQPERLEELELRLKQDVLSEAAEYGGKILLHGEGEGGEMIPVWEQVEGKGVASNPPGVWPLSQPFVDSASRLCAHPKGNI